MNMNEAAAKAMELERDGHDVKMLHSSLMVEVEGKIYTLDSKELHAILKELK